MSMSEDFKKFAFKGNVVDLAVGVIIGAAFGKIVESFVGNIIMPVVSLALPGGNWREASLPLKTVLLPDGKVDEKLSKSLTYGAFIGNVIDFFIVAFVLFLLVSKVMAAFNKKEEVAPEVPAQEKLLAEIRDLLKKG